LTVSSLLLESFVLATVANEVGAALSAPSTASAAVTLVQIVNTDQQQQQTIVYDSPSILIN